jgi:hypothetical protein
MLSKVTSRKGRCRTASQKRTRFEFQFGPLPLPPSQRRNKTSANGRLSDTSVVVEVVRLSVEF